MLPPLWGSAPCYHPSGVWLAGARLHSAQSSPGPQPCTLAAPGQRAVARAAGRRSTGGGRVASGEHVLGLLGRPQVELERDRLGYVRADVPGAVAQAASTTCTLLGPAIQLLLQFLYSYSYSYYSHFYLLRLLLLPLLSPVPAAALRAEDDGEVGRGPAQPLRGVAVGAAVVAGQREHLGYGLGRG